MFYEFFLNMPLAGRIAFLSMGGILFIVLVVLDRRAVKRREREGQDSQPPSTLD